MAPSAIIVFCLLSTAAYASSNRNQGYIVGGTEAVFGEFPSQISIELNGAHVCGATIIDDYWALTSASCVDGVSTSNLRLVSSAVNPQNGLLHRVQIITMHPQYNISDSWANDIALIRVTASDKFPLGLTADIAVVPNQNVSVAEGTAATILGWGSLTEGGSYASILNKAEVTVSNWDSCRTTYEQLGYTLHFTQLCAGADNVGPCDGDGGGPLIQLNVDTQTIVGVFSKSQGCGQPGFPAVYTQVSYYCDWIVLTTGDPFICTPIA